MNPLELVITENQRTNTSSSQGLVNSLPVRHEDNQSSPPQGDILEEGANKHHSSATSTSVQGDPQTHSAESHELEEEGFQLVSRKKNKGKQPIHTQTVCSLPCALNVRKPFKSGLSKFVPIRNIPQDMLDKTKLKLKGSGGAPLSSTLNVKRI